MPKGVSRREKVTALAEQAGPDTYSGGRRHRAENTRRDGPERTAGAQDLRREAAAQRTAEAQESAWEARPERAAEAQESAWETAAQRTAEAQESASETAAQRTAGVQDFRREAKPEPAGDRAVRLQEQRGEDRGT